MLTHMNLVYLKNILRGFLFFWKWKNSTIGQHVCVFGAEMKKVLFHSLIIRTYYLVLMNNWILPQDNRKNFESSRKLETVVPWSVGTESNMTLFSFFVNLKDNVCDYISQKIIQIEHQ